MWHEPTSPTFLVLIGASLLTHVASLALLPSAHSAVPEPPAPPMLVAFAAAPPPPPPPPVVAPPPPPPPVVAAARPVARAPRPAARPIVAPAVEPAPTPRPADAEPPADFSGVTLTNEGAGWSTPVGDGSPLTGPIAAPGPARRPAGHGTATATASAPATDRVVALGDLSRPPRAPDLDDRLALNYPRDARLAGLGGSAVVRARILVDGRVGPTRVVAESGPGFGVACQRTLAGSRWRPPLDRDARPVATDLSYTCTFAVER